MTYIVMGLIAFVFLVLALALCTVAGQADEWAQQHLHEDASMRAQRRRELWERNTAQEEQARPDADVIPFDRGGAA